MRSLPQVVSFLLLSALALSSYASGWVLDSQNSSLHFVSVKKSAIAEVHHFGRLSGRLTPDGQASLDIDLSSVDTGIQIRDERMQTLLFEVGSFASATVTAQFDSSRLNGLASGESILLDQVLTLDLHGVSKSLSAVLRLTGLAGGGVLATTLAPVLLNASDFGLDTGIEKLREVAGLPSISTAVPVTVSLLFNPE